MLKRTDFSATDGDGALQGAPILLKRRSERGVALMLVIVFIALLSILVVNLAYSTFMQAESLGMVERRLKAEYILKSLVNYSASVVSMSSSNKVDSAKEPWGPFMNGIEIPPGLAQTLGVADPNVSIALQITSVTNGIRIDGVADRGMGGPGGGPSSTQPLVQKRREILLRLFKILDFDGELAEPDQTGLFPKRVFSSEELVSNLIDYLDADQESFHDPANQLREGVEGQLPDKSIYRNDGVISRVGELSTIPGFTPGRLRRLEPFITAEGSGMININVAPVEVLQALDPDITPEIAQAIRSFAEGEDGPFQSPQDLQKVPGVPDGLAGKLAGIITVSGNRYNSIARVAYPGQAAFFMRATIVKQTMGEPAKIINPVLY